MQLVAGKAILDLSTKNVPLIIIAVWTNLLESTEEVETTGIENRVELSEKQGITLV